MTKEDSHLGGPRLAAAPLLPAAGGLVAGVVLEGELTASFGIYLAGLILCTAGLAVRRIPPISIAIVTMMAAFCAGSLLSIGASRSLPEDSVALCADNKRRIARVRGTIASEPRVLARTPNPFARWTFGGERTAFLLDTAAVEGQNGDIVVSGLIRVTIGEAVLDLREGERVEVFGWLAQPRPVRNPGGYDWAAYNRRHGVLAGMVCDGRASVRRIDGDRPKPPGWLVRLRQFARGLLTDDLATAAMEEAGLLEAMVLGHRSRLDRRIDERFIRAGCVHFLAVSGLHLAVPLSFIWWVGRRLAFSRRNCAWAALAMIVLYALLAEPRPPILRAATMGTLFCVSLLLRRSAAGLNWVAAAGFILVVISPQSVFDPGFQLSFAAIIGIISLPTPLRHSAVALGCWMERRVFRRPYAAEDRSILSADPNRRQRRLSHIVDRWLAAPLLVAVSAWLACLPIVATHFQSIHWWAPLNSLMVFPLVYALILLGFAKIGVEALVPGWGSVLSDPMTWVDERLLGLVERLGEWPGATADMAAPPWWWTVSWYACLAGFAIAIRRDVAQSSAVERPAGRWPTRCMWAGPAIALIGASVAWSWPAQAPERLTIDVLAVGAGTAVVIELPDGRVILYDAGSASPYDIGRSVVVPYLKHRGIRWIDRVYLSHPNLDHFSGLLTIVDGIETGPVVVNEHFHSRSKPRSPSRYLLEQLTDRGHTVEVMDASRSEWTIAGVRFERLWPGPIISDKAGSNDTSTVIRLSYLGRSILLTGDIEDLGQRALLEQKTLETDVLLLPHHGSVRKSTAAFLAAARANWLVRSSHEPTAETVNGLMAAAGKTPIVNTADVGAIRIVVDDDGVTVCPVYDCQ